jgi:ATP-dependent Clp protease, protease subunit
MQFVKPEITTIGVRVAMSSGALLLAAGARGRRMALPNAKILIHQLWRGFEGQATDIEIHAREVIALKRRIEEIIARHTGQPLETVSKDMERDYFMTAEEAVRHHRHRDRQPPRARLAAACRRRVLGACSGCARDVLGPTMG